MPDIRQTLIQSVYKLLRPLVRVMLKHGVSFNEFAEIAKRAFVDVADKEFLIDGRKQSVSRVCVLTGMHRKDVNRLLSERESDTWDIEPLGRAARVIGGWLSDDRFLSKSGRPVILPFDGEEESFSQLVKLYSGDMPARAILDELKRSGAVDVTETGKLKLVSEAYIPYQTDAQMLQLMGVSTEDLLSTIAHNMSHPPEQSRLQLAVSYDNLSAETVREFKCMAEAESLALLKRYNSWLAARDRDNPHATTNEEGGEKVRAGLGIYYIENTDKL